MSVESTIREALSNRGTLNEVASAGSDNVQPKQGSSKTADYQDLSNIGDTKPNVNASKDTSASSKVDTPGYRDGMPKQGSSKEVDYEEVDELKSGQLTADAAKINKDGTIKPAVKGDQTQDKQGSSVKPTWNEEEGFDEDMLNELSKATLANYINKAAKSSYDLGFKSGSTPIGDNDGLLKNREASQKRAKNIETAARKLTKEGIELDELSKNLLAKYVGRAADSNADSGWLAGSATLFDKKRLAKQLNVNRKRTNGIETAVRKLTRENAELAGLDLSEEELDEISKNTLINYVSKAGKQIGGMIDRGTDKRIDHDVMKDKFDNLPFNDVNPNKIKSLKAQADKLYRKSQNRASGIQTAVKKLTKEEVEAIFGKELTEEHQTKVVEVFEAAIIARVNDQIIDIEENLTEAYEEVYITALEEEITTLTEKMDSYLDYIVDKWLDENQLAVEHGLKLEMTESFMEGLKDLFQEHYINVPDEKFDVLESMQAQIDELKGKLNEEIGKNIDNANLVLEARRLDLFDRASKGLADTEIERFEKLVEGIEFNDPELYLEKLAVIRKNHFTKHLDESYLLEDAGEQGGVLNNDRISRYAQAISRSVKK